jgi:sRNA-binding protein
MADGKNNAEGTIAELVTAFPTAFTLDPTLVRPLKLGIKDDLFAQCGISHRRITAALRLYCNGASYLAATTEGAVRVDLAGEPAGIVTGAEAAHAMEALAVLAKIAAKRAGKAAGAPKDASAPKASPAASAAAPKGGKPSVRAAAPKGFKPSAAAAAPRGSKPSATVVVAKGGVPSAAAAAPAGSKVPSKPATSSPAGPRRLGLDDLRKAAAARKDKQST